MTRYGDRYLKVDEFISYCRDLNVQTSKTELEHYEKIGAMLPVARVAYPEEYVVRQTQHVLSGQPGEIDTSQWPDLERLRERFGYLHLTNSLTEMDEEERFHCFDREMGHNQYLTRPSDCDFRPWNSYRVEVTYPQGDRLMEKTAIHHYSYWQVYQLHYVQHYPDLFVNFRLFDLIPEDSRPHLRSPGLEALSGFEGLSENFDALSYWNVAYTRERLRTFASASEQNGIRRLNDSQAEDYRNRLIDLAASISTNFNLTSDDMYGFLRRMIKMYDDYERDERHKLSANLRQDIFAWETLIGLHTGVTRQDIATELGRTNIHDRRTFLYLDPASKERDYALGRITHAAQACRDRLRQLGDANWTTTEAEIEEFLDHCAQEGIGIIPTSISGMVAIGEQEHEEKYRRVERYTNLKNVLTSYEYLLKHLASKGQVQDPNRYISGLIRQVMANENWISLFNARVSQGITSADDITQFVNNLDTLLGDSQLDGSVSGHWARIFLVTCLARNGTVHQYPSEDRYYGDLFGNMLHSALCAMIYSWKFARSRQWV